MESVRTLAGQQRVSVQLLDDLAPQSMQINIPKIRGGGYFTPPTFALDEFQRRIATSVDHAIIGRPRHARARRWPSYRERQRRARAAQSRR